MKVREGEAQPRLVAAVESRNVVVKGDVHPSDHHPAWSRGTAPCMGRAPLRKEIGQVPLPETTFPSAAYPSSLQKPAVAPSPHRGLADPQEPGRLCSVEQLVAHLNSSRSLKLAELNQEGGQPQLEKVRVGPQRTKDRLPAKHTDVVLTHGHSRESLCDQVVRDLVLDHLVVGREDCALGRHLSDNPDQRRTGGKEL